MTNENGEMIDQMLPCRGIHCGQHCGKELTREDELPPDNGYVAVSYSGRVFFCAGIEPDIKTCLARFPDMGTINRGILAVAKDEPLPDRVKSWMRSRRRETPVAISCKSSSQIPSPAEAPPVGLTWLGSNVEVIDLVARRYPSTKPTENETP